MPEKPKFNPNQSYDAMEEQGNLVAQKPAFNPNKPYNEIKTVEKDPFTIIQETQDKQAKTNDIIQNIPDLDDSKKQIIKDIALRGVKGQELSDAILTLQGKHHKQSFDGSTKYYMDDKGIPRPLASSERPPKDYEVASVWGTQKEADDDNPITTIAKNVYNILPGIAENVVDLIQMPISATTGQEGEWYKSLKNSANYLKMATSESSKKSILNTAGIDEFSDIFEPSRWDFNSDNIAGTVGQIIKSVGEFYLTQRAIPVVGNAPKLAQAAKVVSASYITQLGDVVDEAKAAGLDAKDANRFAAVVTLPLALVDIGMGVEGRIFKDQVAKGERDQLIKNITQGFVKDTEGKITKEALDDAFKATLVANTALVKNWGKQTLGDIAGEGGQEALQAFIQKSGEQLYDKLSDKDKAKFGTDAFGPKAFAEYLQEGIAGALGGSPSGIAYDKIKQITKDNEQSKTAFGLVQLKEGETTEDQNTRINAYKANIENSVQEGKLTKEQADNALTRINAYKDYNDRIGALPLDETEKRQVFDLSFQKQNLETEIGGIKDPKKLNPIEQAQYNVKEKLANDIQKQINEIVLKAQAKEEVNLPKKTIEDVTKLENPKPKSEGEKKLKVPAHIQAILDRNKKEASKKEAPEEKRPYEEIGITEFNKPNKITGGYRTIHKKAVEFIEKQPNKTVVGGVVKLPFEYGGKKNNTYGVQMPDGKIMRFSSSMERPEGFRGHMRTEHLIPDEQLEGFPIGLKVEEIPAFEEGDKPKKVIKAFNANTGKFVGYMKETNTGKNTAKEYSQKQIDYLEHLGTISEPSIDGLQIQSRPIPTEPTPEQTKEDFVNQQIQKLREDEGADFDEKSVDFYKNYFGRIYDTKDGNLFQQGTEPSNQNIDKVVEVIRAAMPRIKVVYDEKLDAKGKWSPKNRTLSVNPYYATKDTPIHEAGHILIDAMGGYSNRVIRSAIEQLKNSPLWAEIAGKYPVTENYTEEDLGKEVLAEAIGREGAGIFDDVTAQNRFKQLLNYIFDWLKRNLGLEKNIAKNLAKQIIAGINTDRVVGGKEQLQQKTTFEEFRKQKGREQEDKDLATLYDALETEEDAEVIEQIEAAISVIEENIENDRAEFEKFQKGIGNVEKIANATSLKDYTLDELIEAYNDARNWGGFADEVMLNNAKMRIANYLNEVGKERLSKHTKFIAENANKKDLHWLDVWFKTLGHISHDFPELQEFYKIFNESWLDMMTERNEKKSELERLGKAVIKDYNKKHGVAGTAVNMFTSNAAKYFEYLEQDGKYRTSTTGLSKAQIELLNFMKNLVKERQKQDEDGNLVENEILKIDKGFKENWKDEGLIPAISYYMGGNNQDTEITYTNPNTGKQEKATYKDAQKAILSYAKKGLAQKGIAMGKLLQAAYKAKKAGEKSNYGLNYNGQLTSKFDQPRERDRGYSKDFYSAAMNFIDDQTHIKHMGKLVPLVDSIEQFYKYLGFEQGKSFGNTLKFIEQWKSQMIYQRKGETDPILDKLLQFFRRLTSMTVMGFNYPAAVMNVALGNYNNWRAESAPLILKGNKRLFGKGGLNKYGVDLLNKYNVVSQDFDSNPKPFAGKIFDMLAFGATRFGEYQIQGSMFLGQLTDKEWDSFEYKNGKLQVKPGVDEKELKKKMLQYKDRVSDIQGKYDEKDRINFMRFEHGKSVLQFKNWIGSYMRERFGKRYIDANNVEHVGSWTTLIEQGFADLRKQMGTKEWWTSKETMANLKGLMAITALAILANSGDEEDKRRKKSALSAENALGQMLFLLDPSQAKYMVKSPVASIGTVEKFITAAEDLLHGDAEKFQKDAIKVVPYNKGITQAKDLVTEK